MTAPIAALAARDMRGGGFRGAHDHVFELFEPSPLATAIDSLLSFAALAAPRASDAITYNNHAKLAIIAEPHVPPILALPRITLFFTRALLGVHVRQHVSCAGRCVAGV